MLRVKTRNVFGSLWCEYEVNVGGIQWERKTLSSRVVSGGNSMASKVG